MTTEQRQNISRGVKLARQRRRRSLAMIESWKRRKANNNNQHANGVPHSVDVPHSTLALDDRIEKIQSLARLWRVLQNERTAHTHDESDKIILGAIAQIQLDIIILAQ